jgi:hypothetical protein
LLLLSLPPGRFLRLLARPGLSLLFLMRLARGLSGYSPLPNFF